jgi:hypothetical protein
LQYYIHILMKKTTKWISKIRYINYLPATYLKTILFFYGCDAFVLYTINTRFMIYVWCNNILKTSKSSSSKRAIFNIILMYYYLFTYN